MASFNYHRFLTEKWGDPDGLIRFLHSYGEKEIQRATVNQWFRRQSVPSEMFAKLVALLETENGAPVSTAEYLE